MKKKEELMNFAEKMLIDKFEKNRKKTVLNINQKISIKNPYSNKLAFL